MSKRKKRISLLALALATVLIVSFAVPGLALAEKKAIEAVYMDISLRINGREVPVAELSENDAEPFIYDGTTYLPIRAVGNALGMDVDWKGETATVTLDDPDIAILGYKPVAADGDFAAFIALLAQITGEDMQAFAGRRATAANVAEAANAAAGLTELAAVLSNRGDADAEAKTAAQIKTAAAAGLLPDKYNADSFTAAELNDAAFRVAESKGLARGYIGRLSDADILSKLERAWNDIPEVLNEDLKVIGGAILDSGAITGFNIRNRAYSVAFDPARTLLYSHSGLKHVKQLAALLKAQGIDARVALEPKTSWYYWEGLNYDQEYDVRFEFAKAAGKAAFDGIIKEYAQRRDDADIVISGSWRAPLYASENAVDGNYVEIVNNTFFFKDSNYYIVSYGLKGASSDAAIGAFKARGAVCVQSAIYTNTAFYNYLASMLPEASDEAA